MGLLDPRPVAKKLIATAGLVLTPRDSISASTGLPARHLAAGEVVQEHVHLAARLDHLLRLVAQPLRDGVGHDAETLPVPRQARRACTTHYVECLRHYLTLRI